MIITSARYRSATCMHAAGQRAGTACNRAAVQHGTIVRMGGGGGVDRVV